VILDALNVDEGKADQGLDGGAHNLCASLCERQRRNSRG